jgi:L-ribulose-5-phosphate 3-epimerase
MSRRLSRREFLEVAAAAYPALRAAAQAQPAGPRIRKAVKFEMVAGEASVLEKFRLLRKLGFEGVDMPAPSDLRADEVVAARDATGLVIHGVVDSAHWGSPLSDPDPKVRAAGREALEQALRDCKLYGGTTVLLVPAVVSQQVAYEDAWERSRREIAGVLALAQDVGVRIAIENVWNNFLLSPLEAARYVDQFESPWIGWYFDVGNVVRYGWPEQWVRILGKRILKLDIKEYSRKKADEQGTWKGFEVELGEGDCNWPAVRAALRAVGYEGWATAEVPGGDASRLAEIARRMDQVLSA